MTRSNPRAKRVTVIIEADDHIEAWQAENPEEISLNIDETPPLHDPYAPYSLRRSELGVNVECGELSRLVSATGMDKVAELLKRVGTDDSAAPAPPPPPAATPEVTMPDRAFDLREPCACGSTAGRIENKNGQACIYCAECGKYQYNASRAEIDRHRRGEFLAELTDLYGYPVTLKDDPTASENAVLLRIGSEIHNQHGFARLPEGEARRLRDALTAWLGDR